MTPHRDFAHNDDIAAAVRGPDPSDRLHRIVMIGLGITAALLTALVFCLFAAGA